MSSERGSKDYSVSTIPRSKEHVQYIENSTQDVDAVTMNEELDHYTKYPNKWSRIRLVMSTQVAEVTFLTVL